MVDTETELTMNVDGVDFARVYRAVESSYRKMEWFRKKAKNLVKEFAGPGYGDNCDTLDKPLNKMFQLIEAYLMLTAPNNPTCDIQPKKGKEAFRGFARLWQDATNNLASEIDLEDTIHAWIADAFFGIGVVKLHRGSHRIQQFGEEEVDPGLPTASNVPIEDWVFDMAAKRWPQQVKFVADKYRVSMDQVREMAERGVFDKRVVDQLEPTSKATTDSDKIERISSGELTDEDELEPMIDLADIWCAKTNKVYTCAISDPNHFQLKKGLPPLGSFEWHDPDNPPYHLMKFTHVPHNVLPVAPAAQLDILDRSINNVARKEINSVEAQKENVVYSAQGEETAKALKGAAHGVMVKGDPDSLRSVKTGGVDQNMHQMLLAMNEFFDMLSGNLPALAGLGPSAATLGQEQIISNASNRKVNSLQSKVAKAAAKLFRGLGIMLWHEEIHEIATTVMAGGYEALDVFKPGERDGNFIDYNFDLNIYSRSWTPPAAQAELLISLVERIFLPMQQMMMQQGGQVDFAQLTEKLSSLLGLSAIDEIIKFTTPPEQEAGGATTDLKPPVTSRNYTRRSVPSEGTAHSRLHETFSGMENSSSNVGAPAA